MPPAGHTNSVSNARGWTGLRLIFFLGRNACFCFPFSKHFFELDGLRVTVTRFLCMINGNESAFQKNNACCKSSICIRNAHKTHYVVMFTIVKN